MAKCTGEVRRHQEEVEEKNEKGPEKRRGVKIELTHCQSWVIGQGGCFQKQLSVLRPKASRLVSPAGHAFARFFRANGTAEGDAAGAFHLAIFLIRLALFLLQQHSAGQRILYREIADDDLARRVQVIHPDEA